MIADLKPYPEYKKSGLLWLGDIPKHWEVRRLSNVAQFNSGKAHEQFIRDSGEHICVTARFVSTDGTARKFCTRNFSPAQRGDVLMVMSDLPNGRALARAFLVKDDASYAVNQRVCIIRPVKMLPALLAYQANRNWGLLQNDDRCNQTHLSNRDYKTLPLLAPPPDEQAAMVRFLDYANGRLERAIRAKRKVILLLHEQKQAIIHRAVTRGLDSTVPLNPSGIPWLGNIPNHWELTPLGAITNYISYGFTNPMPVTDQGPYMLTATDIAMGQIQYATARHTSGYAFQYLLTNKSRPRAGDLLITKDGTLGRVAIADGEPVCINQSVALLRLTPEGVSFDFIADALQAEGYQQMMIFNAGGTTIKHIYITRLVKMKMALPPLHEQRAIAAHIQQTKLAFENATGRIRREIDLLQEYRTRLITDVVTGKLDVRPAARHLPADPVAPEPAPDIDEAAEPEEAEA